MGNKVSPRADSQPRTFARQLALALRVVPKNQQPLGNIPALAEQRKRLEQDRDILIAFQAPDKQQVRFVNLQRGGNRSEGLFPIPRQEFIIHAAMDRADLGRRHAQPLDDLRLGILRDRDDVLGLASGPDSIPAGHRPRP